MGRSFARFTFAATLAASLAVPSPATTTTTWQIDPAHTAAGFSVKHMMISTVRGQFKGVTGTVNWDDQDINKSSVDVTIAATTVDTGEPKRDADLKSANFFDVANNPTITK
jgi:polyisoprenoid-binding protein YceI